MTTNVGDLGIMAIKSFFVKLVMQLSCILGELFLAGQKLNKTLKQRHFMGKFRTWLGWDGIVLMTWFGRDGWIPYHLTYEFHENSSVSAVSHFKLCPVPAVLSENCAVPAVSRSSNLDMLIDLRRGRGSHISTIWVKLALCLIFFEYYIIFCLPVISYIKLNALKLPIWYIMVCQNYILYPY